MSRILVVDDIAENRYLLRAMLASLGHEVDVACDGEEALQTAHARTPDLVVSDILMPRMDGFALCREWKNDPGLCAVPFMFYTATYTEPKDEAFALGLGADLFVVKPQEPEVLARLILELLERRHDSDSSSPPTPEGAPPVDSEVSFLRLHRDTLIRKLESKMAQLEAANGALRQELRERLRAEESLRGSEARFQLLAEVSPVGIFQTDPEGATTYVNRRWTEISGLTVEQALGDGWLRAVHPEDRERLAAGWKGTCQAGHGSRADYRFLRPDGTVTWVIGQAIALVDGAGKVTGFVGTITDITERVRAEEALRASEERYRSLFERSPIGIYRTAPDGSILLANPALVAMLGFSSLEELQKRNLEKDGFGTQSEREEFKAAVETQGEVRGFESRWKRRDGTLLVARETAHVTRAEDGTTLCFEGAVEDVTDRARAEEERRLLATVVDQATEAVVVTDRQATIQYVNPAFERITGYCREEVVGNTPRVLQSGKQDKAFYEEMWATLLERRVWSGHLVNRRKDGSLYEEEATISAVLGDDGSLVNYVGVKRDVTAEMALRQQLTHAQKMEAVGRLAGGIAHDFNNVLQAALSQITVLGLRLRGVAGTSKPLEELVQLVKRGAALTRQLLLFCRRETAVRQPVDLNEIVRGATTLIRRIVRENVSVVVDLDDSSLPVMADRGQCDQVVMNLVVNASDAMPEGGTLRLATGGSESLVWFSVEDTGCGIPDAILQHLFEPFFTTKPVGKGTGLGLSVVHGIVEAHGGSVAVRSEVGKGSSFRITFPRLIDQPILARADAADGTPELGRGERVLLVEDEDGARQGLLETLGSLGYAVTATASGEEALALPDTPAFDVLLTDLVLPGIAGPDLANDLCQRWPGLRVIVMSGYAEDTALGRLRRGLEARLLHKPFDTPAVSRAIRRALEARQTPPGGGR